jgi:hypothetical protein
LNLAIAPKSVFELCGAFEAFAAGETGVD